MESARERRVTDLALALAGTIRHDGKGGVADELTTVVELHDWLVDRTTLLPEGISPVAAGEVADEALLLRVRALRGAVRALFARAVRPGPPSPADAQRLMPVDEALSLLNADAAEDPITPRLDWPEGQPPFRRVVSTGQENRSRILAALARAAISFLDGPQREQLRACTAPRCVRYFVKTHGRQEWCKSSCADRARSARHYARRRQAQSAAEEA